MLYNRVLGGTLGVYKFLVSPAQRLVVEKSQAELMMLHQSLFVVI